MLKIHFITRITKFASPPSGVKNFSTHWKLRLLAMSTFSCVAICLHLNSLFAYTHQRSTRPAPLCAKLSINKKVIDIHASALWQRELCYLFIYLHVIYEKNVIFANTVTLKGRLRQACLCGGVDCMWVAHSRWCCSHNNSITQAHSRNKNMVQVLEK